MIVVDTTVLVYAVGDDHPLRAPSRALIAAIGGGHVEATTTVEVIQEFAHVRARRRGRVDAVDAAKLYLDLLQPLVMPTELDVHRGLELFAAYESLGAFDAVLAAAVLGRDHLTAIASADRAFSAVPGLRFVDLSDHEAMAELG